MCMLSRDSQTTTLQTLKSMRNSSPSTLLVGLSTNESTPEFQPKQIENDRKESLEVAKMIVLIYELSLCMYHTSCQDLY